MAGIETYRRPARYVHYHPLILALAALFTVSSFSQTGWETVAGGAYFEHTPLCVAVTDSHHAVTGGTGGYLARTTDGGTTWIRLYTGSTETFEAIAFSDARRGTVVGSEHSTILRTEDGGITWRRQTGGPFGPAEPLSSVSFSDSANGVIVTLDGKIFHTSNGGENWLTAGPQLSRGLLRVRLKSSYGLAVGYVGDTYRTSDGGRSWYYHSAGTYPRDLHDVFLLDSLNAFVVGDGGAIRRTTDGGIFWTAVQSGTIEDLQSVVFVDGSNGIIGTAGGSMLRSTDGGMSWSPPQPTPMNYLWDMAFASPGPGICVTRFDGGMFRTSDAGASWEPLEYSWKGSYLGVCAAGPGRVFAVGEEGRIAFSSDSGRNWTGQSWHPGVTLRDVQFADPLDGWIAGDSGVVLRTTDGGAGWALQPVPVTGDLHAVAAPGAGIAVVVGENNAILRTIDGGAGWTAQPGPVFDHWQAVSFLDAADGVAAGRNGSIIRTTDGGESWQLMHSAGSLTGIAYPGPGHVYAVGTEPGDTLPGLIRTTDGGATWTFHRPGAGKITEASFANPAHGYVSGGDGELLVTQDSGSSWSNRSPSAAAFRAISMAGPRVAFAAGDSGVIARMRADGLILGACFHDLDHDGLRDPGERGLGGRTLYLGGPFADSTLTTSDGIFGFPALPYGTYTVTPRDALFWEQTAPSPPSADTLAISAGSELAVCREIGFAGPFVRIRIPIFVSDSTSFAHRFVWCGIRPDATFGIWGTDPGASGTDSAEGEYEIPPRSFAELAGLFDARFTDPLYPLNEPSDRFGEGSWTDMRPYRSAAQRDTFLLSFLPGYYFGGNYPVRLSWPPELVAKSFNGPVVLVDPLGATTDMKSGGALTITDHSIESLLLVTQSPDFPEEWLTRWRLLSLPAPVGNGSIRSLFPSAGSAAYSFVTGAGYTPHDTLYPNRGYWLKYTSATDTLDFDPGARVRDTVAVSAGWNLIGSLSAPVDANSVTTDPEGLVTGFFFGYEEGYVVTDSLLPGKAYWVRSEGEGSIILDAGIPGRVAGPRSRPQFERALGSYVPVRVQDADMNAATLYLAGAEGFAVSASQIPPRPPDGVFDVRFGSDRIAEAIRPGKAGRYPVEISSARFPLTVTLSPGLSTAVSLEAGGLIIPLPPGVPVSVPEAPGEDGGSGLRRSLALLITGEPGVPAGYALMQNYPNPFNPATLISYALPVPSRVKVAVYDLLGREVAVLVDAREDAGYRSIVWNAAGAASGVYFCRMDAAGIAPPTAGSFSEVRKLILVR